MSGIIYNAGAGAILQQMRLDAYANNLANVGTVGYKADQPVFRFDENQPEPDPADGSILQLSPFSSNFEQVTDFRSGPMQKTGNPLDVALVGSGFFEIQTDDGIRYSRNGRFSINPEGQLSNSEGWPVMGQGGTIAIDGSQIEINDAGEISVDGDVVGVLRIVDFAEPYNLKKVGNSLFKPGSSDITAREAESFQVTQGMVESSNVNAIRTMTDMIELLRVFQTYQKVIRAADDATAKTVNEVGKIA